MVAKKNAEKVWWGRKKSKQYLLFFSSHFPKKIVTIRIDPDSSIPTRNAVVDAAVKGKKDIGIKVPPPL